MSAAPNNQEERQFCWGDSQGHHKERRILRHFPVFSWPIPVHGSSVSTLKELRTECGKEGGKICYSTSPKEIYKYTHEGTSLAVQWERLHAPNAGGPGSIPGRRTRSCMHAATKSLHAATKSSHAATKSSHATTKSSHAATKSSHATTKYPSCLNKDPTCLN